ncbi:MAG TPA: prolyl oligopeptidase family serine peptidase, partial [Pseudobdellovibrionaceae bacterium]|nr:prolyl oligopeptidase family serine peptidase [Pseudobdellovibrionaceae bacterium]
GNPNVKKDYDYIRRYSPYDNLKAGPYPHLLATTGLHDSQVQYWEPAKWVAKIRDLKTNDSLILMKTDMTSGHGGASGRYEALKEEAVVQAFLLMIDP